MKITSQKEKDSALSEITGLKSEIEDHEDGISRLDNEVARLQKEVTAFDDSQHDSDSPIAALLKKVREEWPRFSPGEIEIVESAGRGNKLFAEAEIRLKMIYLRENMYDQALGD